MGTGTTFVLGGGVAAGLIAIEALGRFGARTAPPPDRRVQPSVP